MYTWHFLQAGTHVCSPYKPAQEFFEDVFEELAQFGELEELNVCDNLADHMVVRVRVLRMCASLLNSRPQATGPQTLAHCACH
jgi:hypothetical protein